MAITRQDTSTLYEGGAATNIVLTLGRSPLNGELLVVIVCSGDDTTFSIQDNGTGTANSWQQAFDIYVGGWNEGASLFWCVNSRDSSSITTITVTFGASVSFRHIMCRTYAGNAVQASQPAAAAQTATGAHGSGTDTITAANITPSENNAVVVAGGTSNGSPVSAGTNFGNLAGGGPGYIQDWIQTTATQTNGAATAGSAGDRAWGVIAFKQAASGTLMGASIM